MRFAVLLIVAACTHGIAPRTAMVASGGATCRVTMRERDAVATYERDDRGRIVSGPRFRRGYDRAGRWIVELRDGVLATRHLDRAGRLASIDYRDAHGAWTTRIARDRAGRIVEKDFERPPGLPPWRERWQYDDGGHLLRYVHGLPWFPDENS